MGKRCRKKCWPNQVCHDNGEIHRHPPTSRLSLPSSVFRLPLAVLRNWVRREALVIKTLMMERTLNFSILFLLLTRLLRFALIVLQLIPRRPRFLPSVSPPPPRGPMSEFGWQLYNRQDYNKFQFTDNFSQYIGPRTWSPILPALSPPLDVILLSVAISTTMSLMMGQ